MKRLTQEVGLPDLLSRPHRIQRLSVCPPAEACGCLLHPPKRQRDAIWASFHRGWQLLLGRQLASSGTTAMTGTEPPCWLLLASLMASEVAADCLLVPCSSPAHQNIASFSATVHLWHHALARCMCMAKLPVAGAAAALWSHQTHLTSLLSKHVMCWAAQNGLSRPCYGFPEESSSPLLRRRLAPSEAAC